MPIKITESQYLQLLDVLADRRTTDIVKTFEELTGIVVRPYTVYQFYDVAWNYLGSNEWDDVREILEKAGIEVVEDGK